MYSSAGAEVDSSLFEYNLAVVISNLNASVYVDGGAMQSLLERYIATLFINGQRATNETQSELLYAVNVDVTRTNS